MATQVRDYNKLGKDIIEAVGGTGNIVAATHCATRLRLNLKEEPADAKAKVEQMPGVISVVEAGGQFQVVIGMHVKDVFASVQDVVGKSGSDVQMGEVKESLLNRAIGTMSACMGPSIYILAGCGILQGVLIILRAINPALADNGTVQIFDLMSWAPFTFLPIMIAVPASKYFNCDTQTALLCAAAMVSPTLAGIISNVANGEEFRFFGLKLAQTSYYSTVLPPVLMVWLLSKIEHFVKKFTPEFLFQLLPPLVSFVITLPVVLLVIGPVSELLANGVAHGYNFLDQHVPAITGAIVAFLWQCLVVFGIHWATTPIVMADFLTQGFNSMQPYCGIAVLAQVGAVFGCAIKTRDMKVKSAAISAGLTGIFGITEPTIYGVTLRFKKPFFAACTCAAISGLISAAIFRPVYFIYSGMTSILTIPNAVPPANWQTATQWSGVGSPAVGYAFGCILSFVLAFIAVQLVGVEGPLVLNIRGRRAKKASA